MLLKLEADDAWMIPAKSLTSIKLGGELESRAGLPLSNEQHFKFPTAQLDSSGGYADWDTFASRLRDGSWGQADVV